jgi:hypothetical protein
MKALQSKTDSGSILNTRILTDADGKAVEGPVPALKESFLKSLTHNFTFLDIYSCRLPVQRQRWRRQFRL